MGRGRELLRTLVRCPEAPRTPTMRAMPPTTAADQATPPPDPQLARARCRSEAVASAEMARPAVARPAFPSGQPRHPARGRAGRGRLDRQPARAQHRRPHRLGDGALCRVDHRAERRLARGRRRAHARGDRDARQPPRLERAVRAGPLTAPVVARRRGHLQPLRQAHRPALPRRGAPGRGLGG